MIIKIKNWPSLQSYKDRTPPWIRLHKTLLDNYDFQIMSADARALLPMLWLLASEDTDPKSGLIRIGYERVTFRLRISSGLLVKVLDEIKKGGFIELLAQGDQACDEIVTDSLQDRNQSVPPETETETYSKETEADYRSAEALSLYNSLAERVSLSKVLKLSDARRKKLKARLKDCDGLWGWKAALRKLEASSFCQGDNDRGWKADFDFLIQEDSFIKLMEGKYDDDKKIRPRTKSERAKAAIARGLDLQN